MFRFGSWLYLARRILWHPLPRYLASWALLVYAGYHFTHEAYIYYDSPYWDCGTEGHTSIDFGGQWFTGKIILEGHGRDLYERHRQRVIFERYMPPQRAELSGLNVERYRLEDWKMGRWTDYRGHELVAGYLLPLGTKDTISGAGMLVLHQKNFEVSRADFLKVYGDNHAEGFMGSLMGLDNAQDAETRARCLLPLAAADPLGVVVLTAAGKEHVWTKDLIANASRRRPGGQVYPPIHAFLYVPLALLPPAEAYRVAMLICVPLALVAGFGLSRITRGYIWTPIGTLWAIIVPHYHDAMTLGHNGSLIVAITVWGYYFINKDQDGRGGAVWGLLAYKPSWAVSYFVMLLVARRWRAALAMGTCAAVQIVLTLPFVGVHSWLEWFHILGDVSNGYGKWGRWVEVSRDMLSVPRRLMNDFQAAEGQRDLFEARLIGFVLMGVVIDATVRLTTLRVRAGAKHWSFAAGAFLLLGFWQSCYHITYYDVMFTTLPLALLLCVPGPLRTAVFRRRERTVYVGAGPAEGAALRLAGGRYGLVWNPLIVVALPLIVWNTRLWNIPIIHGLLMILWLWAGYVWLCEGERPAVTEETVPRRTGAREAEMAV
jgi:hypothetical protein